MNDYVEITTPVREWTVLQHKDGAAELTLEGVAGVSDRKNYPVIRAVDIRTEHIVAYERLAFNEGRWAHTLHLGCGMYRIETGVALQEANFNPHYLGRGDMIRSLFVGEVFIVAGQSNAAGYGRGEIIDMPQYGVSMLCDTWRLAAHPISQMAKDEANADRLNCGHSAWLSLGKNILENTGIPVGLVPTALNGSGIRDWTPGTSLFENMAQKAVLTQAGHLIWYQGCTDTDTPEGYVLRLDEMLLEIRRRLPGIALYIVQLSGTTNASRDGRGWRIVREAQRAAAVRHGAMLIPTYDLTRYSDDIHLGPQDNMALAGRVFSRCADRKPAREIIARRDGYKIELEFAGVTLHRGGVEGVLALDAEGRSVPCEAYADGSVLRLTGCDTGRVCRVTLAFDRLYAGFAPRDENGDCLPYFDIKV